MINIRHKLEELLTSGSRDNRRPVIGKGNESNVKGLHIIGDLAGAPVIKLAMAQGQEVIDYISTLPEMKAHVGEHHDDDNLIDVLIVGSGASGLNAALAAQERGLSYLVLEKSKIANTIEQFPEGKWIYAEPDDTPPKGKLWLDGGRKEDLLARWHEIVDSNQLNVHTEEGLESIEKRSDGTFLAKTNKGEYRCRKIVLATGQRGNPRKLKAPGEDNEWVYHKLYSPKKYKDEDILVVGGGNSAIEAALTLSEQNRVTISYRSGEFARLFKDNREKINAAIEAGQIEVIYNSTVQSFDDHQATLEVSQGPEKQTRQVKSDHAFVLVGAEVPVKFLKSLGLRLENEWTGSLLGATIVTAALFLFVWIAGGHFTETPIFGLPPLLGGIGTVGLLAGLIGWGIKGNRWCWLGLSFFIWFTIYGAKVAPGQEFWPYKGWGYEFLSMMDRPWSFWYTVIYTALMTIFGIQAMKRWGFDRRDKLQIWRFTSLIAFQWVFFFLVPEFLFQWAMKYQWLGESLATDPQFADQAWRSYGIVYAWPLFFYTFFYDPHQIWVVWGVLLTFVIIPLFVLFNGKRYCSWICGCGGLAETFGDRWRHLAPKGKTSIKWEFMNLIVLIVAAVVTLLMLSKDTIALFRQPADMGMALYRVVADVWLVGILPVTLYPFMGGKVWCRYWCPLAKLMGIFSKIYTRLGMSKFHILSNDKCIACNECSRNCQVGIDVMRYALKQEPLNNGNSSCIGCGICVSVCPMDTLYYGVPESQQRPLHQIANAKT